MSDNLPEKFNNSEILIYQSEDGKSKLEVRLLDETVWLTQRQMSELFQKDVRTISEHIQNIFDEGELSQDSTVRNFRIVQQEGSRQVSRDVEHYNLDAIISVGYRVRSLSGTQFRQWATQRLKEFIVKGFILNDERLKEPGGIDYFDELLERIRDIRTSEKRFYQKIKDIYTTSIDYDPKAELTQEFFQTVQNKMHWAIHGHTAAELIKERADANKPNMGLTSWKGSQVRKADVTIAKNYLSADELSELNLIVDQYLSFAELQAKRRQPMHMADWARKLDDFFKLNERDILLNAGKISKELADELAAAEYNKFELKRKELENKKAQEEFEEDIKKLESQIKPQLKKKKQEGKE